MDGSPVTSNICTSSTINEDRRGSEQILQDETTPLLPAVSVDESNHDVPSSTVAYKNIDGSRFWWLIASILLAYALALFDSTLMASSYPVITTYFDAVNAASWLSTVFYLSSTVSQPVYGRISDTIGRRPVYLFSVCLFAVTTLWCALAQSITSLIMARTICGLGAGGMTAMSMILLADVIKIEYRGLYQSYLNMAYGSGSSLGASLGGVLCDHLGWRALFGIQIPFIVGLFGLAYFALPTGLGPNIAASQNISVFKAFRSFDIAGTITLTITVASLILGINLGGNIFPWTHPVVLTSLAIFVVATGLLVVVERRASMPLLPLTMLSRPPFGNIICGNFMANIVTNTVLFNFPPLIQVVWQRSPTASGLYLLSPLVGVSISSVCTGIYIKHTRRLRTPMLLGIFCLLIGPIAVSCLSLPQIPAWAIVLLNPWTSIGQGFFQPSSTVAVLAMSTSEDQAVATTTLGLSRQLGAILGVAVSSWILQNVLLFSLHRNVTGNDDEKEKIISRVRKSIDAITKLHPTHRSEGTYNTSEYRPFFWTDKA